MAHGVGSEIDDERLEGVSVKDLMSTTIFPIAPSMRERSAMHYTGTIWRPPYEADSLIIEATAGCTHHRCKFCTLYEDLPFQVSPVALGGHRGGSFWKRRRGITIRFGKPKSTCSSCPAPARVGYFLRERTPSG